MKKIYILIVLIILSGLTINAQKLEVTGFGGYMLSGKIKTYYGTYDIYNNASYGGLVSLSMRKNTFTELGYTRNDAEFKYYRTIVNNNQRVPISVEYYQVGVLQQLDLDKIKPFATLTIGLARLHVKDKVDLDNDGSLLIVDDNYRFSATIGAGVKVFLSKRIGFRLQGRMLLPMEADGLFISGGTGGTNGGVSFRVPIMQGDFTAGLIIAI